jgi:hypothetical protein
MAYRLVKAPDAASHIRLTRKPNSVLQQQLPLDSGEKKIRFIGGAYTSAFDYSYKIAKARKQLFLSSWWFVI